MKSKSYCEEVDPTTLNLIVALNELDIKVLLSSQAKFVDSVLYPKRAYLTFELKNAKHTVYGYGMNDQEALFRAACNLPQWIKKLL